MSILSVSIRQVKAARSLLDWSQVGLAQITGISLSTIKRIEARSGMSECEGRATGEPSRFPVKAAKKARPSRIGTAFWIERDGKVWLVRRPGKGMLGGMRALPDDGWSARADGSDDAPLPGSWRAGGVVRHGFTHFDLELGLAIYAGDRWRELRGEGEWWPVSAIEDAGLPTLFAKAARLAVAG